MTLIRPILILDGNDVSRYFVSSHCEMTINSSKDPNKYDLTLANVGGYFFAEGMFAPKNYEEQTAEGLGQFTLAPKNKVSLKMEIWKAGCEEAPAKTITIFNGEIQKAEADELYLRIEGSCTQGGMTSRLHGTGKAEDTEWVWRRDDGATFSDIVNDLLDAFEITGERHIHSKFNEPINDVSFVLYKGMDFDSCFDKVAQTCQALYYFDENDDFWFTTVTAKDGFTNLTGVLLRGSNASTMVGYANHVDVYGGTIDDGEEINERKTHHTIHEGKDVYFYSADATEAERAGRGIITAPAIELPNASYEKCKEVAEAMLKWYLQYKDVPTIKVVNKAPGVRSKVAYQPWNGSMPPVSCAGGDEAVIGPVYGIVTRRVVDISAESGMVTSLDVTTNFEGMPKSPEEADDWTYYGEEEIHYVD